MGVPMATFVRGGGTTTMAHDRHIHEVEADAEARRDEQDRMRQVAGVPIEQGGAKLWSQQTGSPKETPKVLLTYLTPGGEPWIVSGEQVQCLADVIVGEDVKDLVLQIVCPRCKARGVPQGQCQLTLRQSNRMWHLDSNGAASGFIYDGEWYLSAGTVMDSERFSCPDCGWAARIDRNFVRQESF
jgi:hypothetical protein